MIRKVAAPLPECDLCETPTKREVHTGNGGLCSACAGGIADTVRMLRPIGVHIDLDDARRRRLLHRAPVLDDQTVYIERYTPPVPGQTELPLEDS